MLVRRLHTAFRRHPLRLAIEVAVVYVFLWSLLDPAFAFLGFGPPGARDFILLIALSCLLGLMRALPPLRVGCMLPSSGTQLSIEFGDLFLAGGLRAIPVNEFFDSQLGDHVSPKSLHGQLLQGPFGGQPDVFDRQVEGALAGVASDQVHRPSGRTRRYPVGTAARLETGNAKYVAFVSAHTDTRTLKAFANVGDLWAGLEGLWEKAREVSGGDPLYVPLVGSGLSGVGLPAQHLLAILVMSIVEANKQWQICREIVIVLSEAIFDQVDIRGAISLAAK